MLSFTFMTYSPFPHLASLRRPTSFFLEGVGIQTSDKYIVIHNGSTPHEMDATLDDLSLLLLFVLFLQKGKTTLQHRPQLHTNFTTGTRSREMDLTCCSMQCRGSRPRPTTFPLSVSRRRTLREWPTGKRTRRARATESTSQKKSDGASPAYTKKK